MLAALASAILKRLFLLDVLRGGFVALWYSGVHHWFDSHQVVSKYLVRVTSPGTKQGKHILGQRLLCGGSEGHERSTYWSYWVKFLGFCRVASSIF